MEPNDETKDAMREARMLSCIRDLLKHAVYDREADDNCIMAVEDAERILNDHSFGREFDNFQYQIYEWNNRRHLNDDNQ